MKAWLKRLKRIVARNPQLKIIFIGLPCVALLAIAALLIVPAISIETNVIAPDSVLAAEMPENTVVQTASPSAAPTDKPKETEKPKKKATDVVCTLRVKSSENDMYVQVCDGDGNALHEVFNLCIEYPDGEICRFYTEEDGSCYIVELEEGNYSITFEEKEGFVIVKPVNCAVKGKIAYTVIENISEQQEIKTSDEVAEQTEEKEAEPTFFAEEVREPQETIELSLIDVHVLDENGNQTYNYTYSTGPNGALLLADTSEESDVYPIEENGKLAYGLRRVIKVFYADGTVGDTLPDETVPADTYTVEESSDYVSLFNADNTPNGIFVISAEPIIEQQQVTTGWVTIEGRIYYYDANGNPVTGLKSIGGKMYYFDTDGVRASAVGVDVSSFNHDINWGMVKSAGIDFAIIRIGGRSWYNPGALYDDVKFADNIRQAKAAGVNVGVYFYSMAINTNEAVEEASLVLERLGGMSLEMPIFIDMEYSGIYPNARADWINNDMRNEIIRAFCTTVENSGYRAGYYSGQSYMTHNIYMDQFANYTVWLASYTETGYKPKSFANHYDIWQMTDSGFVNGINGCVDIDILW